MSTSVLSSKILASNFQLMVEQESLIEAISFVENQAQDPNAVGDKHLTAHAYGLLQIRQPYLDDVNRIAGEEVYKKWGKETLTVEDMKDKEKAEWAFVVYMSHYGKVYTRRTGEIPTIEVYARMHNGGPNGWRRDSTLNFARKVQANFKK